MDPVGVPVLHGFLEAFYVFFMIYFFSVRKLKDYCYKVETLSNEDAELNEKLC